MARTIKHLLNYVFKFIFFIRRKSSVKTHIMMMKVTKNKSKC